MADMAGFEEGVARQDPVPSISDTLRRCGDVGINATTSRNPAILVGQK